jgi:16S rRNA C967 or C1407 C5-methylase (RsmB/RsmF family)/NOL1/NOP2/fmu family ribosome biogenesis protein
VQLPEALLNSLAGIKGFHKEAFEKVHASCDQVTSVRINPSKVSESQKALSFGEGLGLPADRQGEVVPWTQYGYYLSKRPSFTFDPLFHAGCYYVQEASSMFLEQALKQTVDLLQPLRILDLCAAPGGKTTHIQSLITNDSLLVSNEVIKSRANILKDNSVKWGCDNVVITNNDPKDFSKLQNYFDVIVIDAPCSGSGLFRRDKEAINEWSINNVALCSQRQQRILADVWPSLKEGGVLIYATCSYSKQEDEEILDWIHDQLPVANCQLSIDKDWGIIETVSDKHKAHGYRFWPYHVKGEGFFLSCFRKTDGGNKFSFKSKNKPEPATKKETALIQKWTKGNRHLFIQKNNLVYAIPWRLAEDVNILLTTLHVLYSGIIVGEIFRDELAPAHSLAMSSFVNDAIPHTELDYEAAIQYLKRKDFSPSAKKKGWMLVTYQGCNLGWVKVLANRINNYYPKELRILKDL